MLQHTQVVLYSDNRRLIIFITKFCMFMFCVYRFLTNSALSGLLIMPQNCLKVNNVACISSSFLFIVLYFFIVFIIKFRCTYKKTLWHGRVFVWRKYFFQYLQMMMVCALFSTATKHIVVKWKLKPLTRKTYKKMTA